jgi:HAD superfamily hydrolase (TIGR01509 family)
MPRAEPKFIYFDMGNVLLHFDHHRAARQMADVAGIPEEIAWKTVFETDLEHQYEAGQITGSEFHRRFCEASHSRPDCESLLHAVSDIFEVNAPIIPVVLHLRRAGYPLGILSNTPEAHWQFVSTGRYALIRDFFSITALSFKIGAMKPDKRIFSAAASLANTAPGEIFFTDDRVENVAGARDCGFDAVLFENPHQLALELRARNIRWEY